MNTLEIQESLPIINGDRMKFMKSLILLLKVGYMVKLHKIKYDVFYPL